MALVAPTLLSSLPLLSSAGRNLFLSLVGHIQLKFESSTNRWEMLLFVLEEVISCVQISSPPLSLQCCKLAHQLNPAMAQAWLERCVCMCVFFLEFSGKEGEHLVVHAHTHTHTHRVADGGLLSMGGEFCESGQLPLLLHLFESLLALSGSSCKYTLTLTYTLIHFALHTLAHTGCFRFSYLLLFFSQEAVKLQRGCLSNLILCTLRVTATSCLSNDHKLASDWLIYCETGTRIFLRNSLCFVELLFLDYDWRSFCYISRFNHSK